MITIKLEEYIELLEIKLEKYKSEVITKPTYTTTTSNHLYEWDGNINGYVRKK